MIFQTASNIKRPIRLSSTTRKWAYKSLHGEYGSKARQTPYVNITDEHFESLDLLDKYDILIKEIVQNAPIRICEEELISGSATLGASIDHKIPAYYKDEYVFFSISHITIDYKTTLEKGVDYYKEHILVRLKDDKLDNEQKRFLKSLLHVIDCLYVYHNRYLNAVKDVKPKIYENLLQVPFKPAKNFYQAVQSLWFIFSFVRLCGNWPGIGRIDYLLGDYLERDLYNGVLTVDSAREILASFFIKGTEWIEKDTTPSSGDAQHYQNIVLSGLNEDGKDVTNKVTYLVLDIIEELGISDFPITVRVNQNTCEKLLNKVARVIRHGGGVIAIYNEPLILKSLVNYGYPYKEALNFANDGCWEVQIPGKTNFIYSPFDSLALLQHQTLKDYNDIDFSSFESLYQAYVLDLENLIKNFIENSFNEYITLQNTNEKVLIRNLHTPDSVISLFENGCIENARSYSACGAIYNVVSPHLGGIADTVNSLYAIKKLVFDQKVITFDKFMDVLRCDWQGYEELKNHASNLKFYGTDNDEVDEIYKRILHDFYLSCTKYDNNPIVRFPAGISTFGREIAWASNRLATPQGKHKGLILAGNTSPSPNTDTEGATAVIKSYCKADLSEMVTGAALDLKLSPQTLIGNNGIIALKSLIKGFVNLGGYFLQIDTVSAQTLKKAQENPKEYKTLSVRVSGWNARFITLTKEWQDIIIQRTEHNA